MKIPTKFNALLDNALKAVFWTPKIILLEVHAKFVKQKMAGTDVLAVRKQNGWPGSSTLPVLNEFCMHLLNNPGESMKNSEKFGRARSARPRGMPVLSEVEGRAPLY